MLEGALSLYECELRDFKVEFKYLKYEFLRDIQESHVAYTMKDHLATSGTGWPPFKVGLLHGLHTQPFMSVIPIPFTFSAVTI